MNTKLSPSQARFDAKTCAADEIDPAIPATAPGVAVVYAEPELKVSFKKQRPAPQP